MLIHLITSTKYQIQLAQAVAQFLFFLLYRNGHIALGMGVGEWVGQYYTEFHKSEEILIIIVTLSMLNFLKPKTGFDCSSCRR